MSEREGGGGRVATLALGTRAVVGITTGAIVATRLTAAIRKRPCGGPARRVDLESLRRSPRRSLHNRLLRLPFRTRRLSSPCSVLQLP